MWLLQVKIIAPRLGTLHASNGVDFKIDGSIAGNPSVVFDAVFIPGGISSIQVLLASGEATHFVLEAFVHLKAIAAAGDAVPFLERIGIAKHGSDQSEGIFAVENDDFSQDFLQSYVEGIAKHRFWNRKGTDKIPV